MRPRSAANAAVLILLCLSVTGSLAAQLAPPFLVFNLNTDPNDLSSAAGTKPIGMGDDLYFISWGGLWRTDGTSRGTYFVAPDVFDAPIRSGGQLFYFRPRQGGGDVWVTDGTTPGTRKIADGTLYGGSACGTAFCFSTGGAALRITDGTPEGTRVLAYTEHDVPDTNLPTSFATLDGQVYFSGFDWAHGSCVSIGAGIYCGELWTSDGTADGTRLVFDLNPGPAPSSPRNPFVNGGKLYYSALTFPDGQPLSRCPFVIDGVGALPRRLGSVCETYNGRITFFAIAGRTYFDALGHLWITDGTNEGTRRLNDVLGVSGAQMTVGSIGAARERLVYTVHTPSGSQVWSADFDHGSRVLLFDTYPSMTGLGTSRTGDVLLQGLEVINGPRSLWRSDGTVSGTKLLRSASVGFYTSLVATSRLDFFEANASGKSEIWRTDGTPAGTRWVETTAPIDHGSVPVQLTGTPTQLFFLASAHAGERALYRADARGEGVTRLADCGSCRDLTASGGRLYFKNGEQWWTSDGTAEGTEPFSAWLDADVVPRTLPVEIGGTPLFVGSTPAQTAVFAIRGRTLELVATLPSAGAPLLHVQAGGRLLFILDGLRVSDGTSAGTRLLAPIAGNYGNLTAGGGRAFYKVGFDGIWVTDGTAEGTRLALTRNAVFLAVRDGVLFFIDTQNGSLWRTDGTAEGTFELPRSTTEGFEHAIDAGPHLALMTYPNGNRVDVWTSDGTREGTVFRRQLPSGFYQPAIPFRGTDGSAYSAYRSPGTIHLANLSGGPDLQTTFPQIDPNVEGVQDLSDLLIAPTAQAFFFAATSKPHGAELWAMRFDGTTRYRLPELRVENAVMVELFGGVRAAVFRVRMTGIETTPVTVSWATSDGSAVAGRDYTAASGTLTLGGYSTTKAVIIPVSSGSTGTFRLTLSFAEGADIISPVATAVLTTSNRRSVVRR